MLEGQAVGMSAPGGAGALARGVGAGARCHERHLSILWAGRNLRTWFVRETPQLNGVFLPFSRFHQLLDFALD